jgi:ubiquinone/menaquinone biosynthesis C-methylase UbiE
MTFDPDAYKQAITQEWGRTAPGWHRWIPTINEWQQVATETMLNQARVSRGHRVIDIAAGDGGQSIAAARRVGPTGTVLATDIAPEFVELARVVAERDELTQLHAEVMDAEALTSPDNSFDAAICRLGLMYLPNLQTALAEVRRVLRPGGRLAAIVFTSPAQTPFFSIPVRLIRERRNLPAPPAGQPGPFTLGAPGVLRDHLEQAGYRDVLEQRVSAPIRFASAEECVQWRREASGTMQQLVSDLDPEEQAQIWQEIVEALRQFETPDGFESPCELLVCSAAT